MKKLGLGFVFVLSLFNMSSSHATDMVCSWHGTCVGINNTGPQQVSGTCSCAPNSVMCASSPSVPSSCVGALVISNSPTLQQATAVDARVVRIRSGNIR